MFDVVKVPGGFAVQAWDGTVEVAYRNRKHADQYAIGATNLVFGAAEQENERRDRAAEYLAARADRAPVINPQLSLF